MEQGGVDANLVERLPSVFGRQELFESLHEFLVRPLQAEANLLALVHGLDVHDRLGLLQEVVVGVLGGERLFDGHDIEAVDEFEDLRMDAEAVECGDLFVIERSAVSKRHTDENVPVGSIGIAVLEIDALGFAVH